MLISLEGIDASGKTTVEERLCTEFPSLTSTTEPTSPGPNESIFGEAVREVIKDDEIEPVTVLLTFLADHSHHLHTVIKPSLSSGENILCDRYIDSRIAYQSVSIPDLKYVEDVLSASEPTPLSESISTVSIQPEILDSAPETIAFTALIQRTSDVKSLPDVFKPGDIEVSLPEVLESSPLFDLFCTSGEFEFLLSSSRTISEWITLLHSYGGWSRYPDCTFFIDISAETSTERLHGVQGERFEEENFLSEVRQRYLELAEKFSWRFIKIDGERPSNVVSSDCAKHLQRELTENA